MKAKTSAKEAFVFRNVSRKKRIRCSELSGVKIGAVTQVDKRDQETAK
jgi:hypothetical protein